MNDDYQMDMGLKLLRKGPVKQCELNTALYAHVSEIVSEPHSVRIVFAVHSTKSGDVIFEDRIWDPKYKPGKFLNRNLKLSISLSKRYSASRLSKWGHILDVPFDEAYGIMHDRDILKAREIKLLVMPCSGNNDIQYIKILHSTVTEKADADDLWMLEDKIKPVEPPAVQKFVVHENASVNGDFHMAMITRMHSERMRFLETHPEVWEGILGRIDDLIDEEAMIEEQGEENQRDWEEYLQNGDGGTTHFHRI